MLVHLYLLPDPAPVRDVVRARGHTLVPAPRAADLVVTGGPLPATTETRGAVLQFGGPLHLGGATHVPVPVLCRAFAPTPVASALGVDLLAAATLLTDPPRTAVAGIKPSRVAPLVTNTYDQHVALTSTTAHGRPYWWVHEDSLDTVPWIDAILEQCLVGAVTARAGPAPAT